MKSSMNKKILCDIPPLSKRLKWGIFVRLFDRAKHKRAIHLCPTVLSFTRQYVNMDRITSAKIRKLSFLYQVILQIFEYLLCIYCLVILMCSDLPSHQYIIGSCARQSYHIPISWHHIIFQFLTNVFRYSLGEVLNFSLNARLKVRKLLNPLSRQSSVIVSFVFSSRWHAYPNRASFRYWLKFLWNVLEKILDRTYLLTPRSLAMLSSVMECLKFPET